MASVAVAYCVNSEFTVLSVPASINGLVVSQTKLKSFDAEFPATSVTVSLITYVSSASAETVVSSDVVALNVTVPEPETLDQRYVAIPEVASVVEAFCVNVELAVLSVPASTIGAVLSTVTVTVEVE